MLMTAAKKIANIFKKVSDDPFGRSSARLLEYLETKSQKRAFLGGNAGASYVRQTQQPALLDAAKARDIYQSFDAAFEEHLSNKLGMALSVGRGLRSHAHEFRLSKNEDGAILFEFLDPEGFLGRRDPESPEISQVLVLEIQRDGRYFLGLSRFSAQEDFSEGFKTMADLESLATIFRREECLKNKDGAPYQGPVYVQALETERGLSFTSSNAVISAANLMRARHQVGRIISHAHQLLEHGHMQPLSERGFIQHRHCEPGATCR